MVHYSLVIPARNAGEQIRDQLPELCQIFKLLTLPYEIIVVDDASAAPSQRILQSLLDHYPAVRVLRLEKPCGVSVALSAGMATTRGDIVIAMAPGQEFRAEQIPHLVSKLSRGDIVFGRRAKTAWQKAWQRVARLPRWALLGLETRDPDCLFWAARREAVEGITLAKGQSRYLPSLVAMRGYRVSEMAVDASAASCRASDSWPNPLDLLSVWWLKCRFQQHEVRELFASAEARPRVRVVDFDHSNSAHNLSANETRRRSA